MKAKAKISCVASSELYDEVISAATEMGLTQSEFMRLAIIHALRERPEAAFARSSGTRGRGRPARTQGAAA